MAQVTKELNDAGKLEIRAVLSGGLSLSLEQAARDVAELFATDIEGTLRGEAPELATRAIHALVRDVLERRLSSMLSFDAVLSAATSSLLPAVNLKPSEVIEQRKVSMSLASLYRYVDANKFYCVVPPGQTNGREFPAWQFVEPVPDLLPPILAALRGSIRTEIHAFLVAERDELNELAPAELLAGIPFETRAGVHASQLRLMQLPATDRQRRVLNLAGTLREGMAD
ncbi:hypothetical protein [Caballeronia sp. M23-90]